jgi:hypothetical protein
MPGVGESSLWRRPSGILGGLLLVVTFGGCDSGEGGDAVVAENQPTSETHIDSVMPMAVALERFRVGLAEPNGLGGGADSRDELVQTYVTSLATEDTLTLASLALNAAEYGWLYFPTTVEAFPPYELPPDVGWLRLQGASQRGLSRALREFGGQDLRLEYYECQAEPLIQANNRVWTNCVTTIVRGGSGRLTATLFAAILERGGKFKFISYSNDF